MRSGDVTNVMDTMSRLSDKVKRNNGRIEMLSSWGKVPLDDKMSSLVPDCTLSFYLEVAKLLIAPMIM